MESFGLSYFTVTNQNSDFWFGITDLNLYWCILECITSAGKGNRKETCKYVAPFERRTWSLLGSHFNPTICKPKAIWTCFIRRKKRKKKKNPETDQIACRRSVPKLSLESALQIFIICVCVCVHRDKVPIWDFGKWTRVLSETLRLIGLRSAEAKCFERPTEKEGEQARLDSPWCQL